jgi:DNA primase
MEYYGLHDPKSTLAGDRIDWNEAKDRISLASVATALLGPAQKREGRSLLWRCPLHQDVHPSFRVDLKRNRWRCWTCAVGGDAPELVMRLQQVTFPQAVRIVAELSGIVVNMGAMTRPTNVAAARPQKAAPTTSERSSGLPLVDATSLLDAAFEGLWSPNGAQARSYLRRRGLTDETIRTARLGFTPNISVPTRDGDRCYSASGIVIPWFVGDRLALIKIRRLDDRKPKYAEAFRDGPLVYPNPDIIRPGFPLVISEGEFDAMLLGQQLPEASVITLGSASVQTDPDVLARMLSASPWFVATDADTAGDNAASKFPSRARRVRPPDGKDWTELHATGCNRIRYHWGRFLPLSRPWHELESLRWGSTGDDSYDVDERKAIQSEASP